MVYTEIPVKNYGGEDGDILLVKKASKRQTDKMLERLVETLPVESGDWEQRMKNGRCRLTLGPKGTGLLGGKRGIVPSHPWEGKKWKWLRDFVSARTGELIKGGYIPAGVQATALINYYPNGSSGINYHHDRTDNCLGTVASYTFGPEGMSRKFLLRNIKTGTEYSIHLSHGDWLVMGGTTNANYQHAIETMKKSEEGWSYWRYNISLRFLTDIAEKKKKQYKVCPKRTLRGCYSLRGVVDARHPLTRVAFVPVTEVPFHRGYYIRFKSWGNVGAFMTGNRLVIGKSREVTRNYGVRQLPDFYLAAEDRDTFRLLVDTLRELEPYFQWRYPRGSRFTDRKIEFGDFVDLLYEVLGNPQHSFRVPEAFQPGIHPIQSPKTPMKKTKAAITKRFGYKVSKRELFDAPLPGPERKGIIWAKNCSLPDGRELPGLNMQYPYSRMLFGGMGRFVDVTRKTIETRTWQMGAGRLHTPLVIIETPGKLGKKHGVKEAQIIGVVELGEEVVYNNNDEWMAARGEHCCDFDISGKKYL